MNQSMKLVFYSGGSLNKNAKLDREFLRFFQSGRKKRMPRITYIPSSSEGLAEDFREFAEQYRRLGVKDIECLPVDQELKPQDLRRALASDAIYLGGGNTFYFLHHLRKAKMVPKLRQFVKRGGVLMGLSAGGIVMTPSIKTAEVPSLEADENEVELKNFRSMALVDFEFSPHYTGDRRSDKELRNYSKQVKRPVYACDDGTGIVVNNGKLTFVGKVQAFVNGEKIRVN